MSYEMLMELVLCHLKERKTTYMKLNFESD